MSRITLHQMAVGDPDHFVHLRGDRTAKITRTAETSAKMEGTWPEREANLWLSELARVGWAVDRGDLVVVPD